MIRFDIFFHVWCMKNQVIATATIGVTEIFQGGGWGLTSIGTVKTQTLLAIKRFRQW